MADIDKMGGTVVYLSLYGNGYLLISDIKDTEGSAFDSGERKYTRSSITISRQDSSLTHPETRNVISNPFLRTFFFRKLAARRC